MVARLELSSDAHHGLEGKNWLGKDFLAGSKSALETSSPSILATDDIYPSALPSGALPTALTGLDGKAIEQQLLSAKSLQITTAAQNNDNHTKPDYIIDSAGQLHATGKPPSADGSVNIQIESNDTGSREAIRSANENQKQSIRELIRHFQKTNPNAQVPLEWQWKLDSLDKNVPPDVSPQRLPPPPSQDRSTPVYDNPGPSPGYGGGGGGGGGGGYEGGRPRSSARVNDIENDNDLFQRDKNYTPPKLPQPIAGDMLVEGEPTISPQQIDKILADFHSPAQGIGQYLYDKGKECGINPAVALAFFVQESGCGTKGVARNTKSWGNIKGSGPAGSYHGFRAYHDYKEGVDDWYQLIKDKYVDKWGLKTVGGILQKYAPPSENNTRQYVQNVKGMVQGWAQNENKTLNA